MASLCHLKEQVLKTLFCPKSRSITRLQQAVFFNKISLAGIKPNLLKSHHVTESNKEQNPCKIHKMVPPLKSTVGGVPEGGFLPLYSAQ